MNILALFCLRGRYSLVHLTMTLTIGYYFLSFIRLRKFPSIHTLLEFGCWTWMDAEFCQRLFFKTIEMIIWFFSLVSWYDQSYWLIFESCTSMHSWDKPLLSHDDSFHILRFDLLPFCWEFLHLCSWAILAYSFLFFHFSPWFCYQSNAGFTKISWDASSLFSRKVL